MAALAVADRVVGVLNRLEPGESLEVKLKRLLSSEIRRRLWEYERIDRQFQQKYQVSLKEFEAQGLLKKLGYSFQGTNSQFTWLPSFCQERSILRKYPTVPPPS